MLKLFDTEAIYNISDWVTRDVRSMPFMLRMRKLRPRLGDPRERIRRKSQWL